MSECRTVGAMPGSVAAGRSVHVLLVSFDVFTNTVAI